MKIAVLGAGNMGLSFSKSFLKYELIKPQNLHLITRSQNKKEKIKSVFSESEISSFDEVKNLEADLIIIAVKPQDFAFVAENLTFKIPEKSLVLSIMAGISIEKIHFFYYGMVVNLLHYPMNILRWLVKLLIFILKMD